MPLPAKCALPWPSSGALSVTEFTERPTRAGAQQLVDHVNEVLTMHMGPDFTLVNLSVDFDDRATADQAESTIGEMDKTIKQRFPEVKRVFIEAEKRA
jgi:divalent metal cation (Fe/Co/Zn/Cd) transporter